MFKTAYKSIVVSAIFFTLFAHIAQAAEWQGPITKSGPGNANQPFQAQSEAILGPDIAIQTVWVNNQGYVRYFGTVNQGEEIDLTNIIEDWSGVVPISALQLPAGITGDITGYDLAPSLENSLVQTVFIGNRGFRRTMSYNASANTNPKVTFSNVSSWAEIQNIPDGTVRAYTMFYDFDNGGYHEQLILDNQFRQSWYGALGGTGLPQFNQPLFGKTFMYTGANTDVLPGEGGVTSYSATTLADKTIFQTVWQGLDQGYYRSTDSPATWPDTDPDIGYPNNIWQGPITKSGPGSTNQPFQAQTEVILGPDLALQTVWVNNQGYDRYYGTINDGERIDFNNVLQDWSDPVPLSGAELPSGVSGNVTGYDITSSLEGTVVQTIFVGNRGFRRTLSYTTNPTGTPKVSYSNRSAWTEIQNIPDGTVRAYTMFYDFDNGGYHEQLILDNQFRQSWYGALGGTGLPQFNQPLFGKTFMYTGVKTDALPGEGDVTAYSSTTRAGNGLFQSVWRGLNQGYFRTTAGVGEWPQEDPEVDPPEEDLYDVNNDGVVNIVDVIEIIREIFR